MANPYDQKVTDQQKKTAAERNVPTDWIHVGKSPTFNIAPWGEDSNPMGGTSGHWEKIGNFDTATTGDRNSGIYVWIANDNRTPSKDQLQEEKRKKDLENKNTANRDANQETPTTNADGTPVRQANVVPADAPRDASGRVVVPARVVVQDPETGQPGIDWSQYDPIRDKIIDDPIYFAGKQKSSATTAKGYLLQLKRDDPNQYNAVVARMAAAGLNTSNFTNIQGNWENAIALARIAYDSSPDNPLVDAFSALELIGSRTPKPPTTSSTITTSLTSSSDARAALSTQMETDLGRKATDAEVATFTKALNSLQRSNPGVETTRTTGGEVDANGNPIGAPAVTNRTETGGFNVDQYTKDYTASQPEYAEFQAATNYMDALFTAFRS